MKTALLEKLVATAGRLFRERGYSAVRMDDLAFELGMSKKTLYQCVASKEDLLSVICERLHENFARHSREVIQSRTLTLEEKICRHTEYCRTSLAHLYPAFFLDVKRHAPRVHERLMAYRDAGVTDTVSALLVHGQREGVVRKDLSMRLVIESFRTVVLNLMQPETLDAMDVTASQAAREIMELFFNGILIRRRTRTKKTAARRRRQWLS